MLCWKREKKKRNMKTGCLVLDASALLAYLKDEPGSDELEKAFRAAEKGSVEIFINQINLGEVYYIIARERSLETAGTFFHDLFQLLPVKVVPNSTADVLAASEIKIRHDLHYTDAFAALTAMQRNASLVTADRDFEKVAGEIKIRWIR